MKVLMIIYRVIVVTLMGIPFLMVIFVISHDEEVEDRFLYWCWTKVLRLPLTPSDSDEELKIKPKINNSMWRKK